MRIVNHRKAVCPKSTPLRTSLGDGVNEYILMQSSNSEPPTSKDSDLSTHSSKGDHPAVTLRPTRLRDMEFVLEAEQHPDNAPYVEQWSQSQHEAAIVSENDAHFMVEAMGRPIGYVILSGLQNPHKTILLRRIVIGPKGKGYGRQTLRWVKDFTFKQLGFHRLWLDVMVSNERAQRLYASEGLTAEGRLRDAYRTESGDYEDMFILSILESD